MMGKVDYQKTLDKNRKTELLTIFPLRDDGCWVAGYTKTIGKYIGTLRDSTSYSYWLQRVSNSGNVKGIKPIGIFTDAEACFINITAESGFIFAGKNTIQTMNNEKKKTFDSDAFWMVKLIPKTK